MVLHNIVCTKPMSLDVILHNIVMKSLYHYTYNKKFPLCHSRHYITSKLQYQKVTQHSDITLASTKHINVNKQAKQTNNITP